MSDIPKDGTAFVKQEPTESGEGSETDSCEFLDITEDLENVEVVQKDQESCNEGQGQVAKVDLNTRMLINRVYRSTRPCAHYHMVFLPKNSLNFLIYNRFKKICSLLYGLSNLIKI